MGGTLHGLLARYDGTLLQPPEGDATGARAALAQAPGPRLLDWCHDAPRMDCASLAGAQATALAQALALHLDGSDRLAACPGAGARLALRLRVKADDLALAWRAPRRGDCWDSGWLADGPEALARLAAWQPRRATLVLLASPAGQAQADADARWHAAVRLLAARAAALARPVRLLRVVDTPQAGGQQSLRLMPDGMAAVTADKSIPDTA